MGRNGSSGCGCSALYLIRRFWLWLLDLFGLVKAPSPLQELIMANGRLNWTLPIPTARQRPLSHVRVESRVSVELPWAEIATVPIPDETLLLQDIAPGDWQFRGIVVDDSGAESTPLEASLAVPFEGPSPLAEFTATLE